MFYRYSFFTNLFFESMLLYFTFVTLLSNLTLFSFMFSPSLKVIHNFLTLMFSYVGVSPGKKNPVPDSVKGRILHHTFPVTLFQVYKTSLRCRSHQP